MHLRWFKFVSIRKKLRYVSRILLVTVSFLAVFLIFDPQKRVTKLVSMKYSGTLPKNQLKILLWPPDIVQRSQIIQLIEKQLQEDCSHEAEQEIPAKCTFTADDTMLNEVDAILDFVVNLKTPLPPPSKFTKKNPIRIFYQLEVPSNYGKKPPTFPSEYNWTLTYRKDSDVQTPFGFYEPLTESNGLLDMAESQSHNSPIEIPWEELSQYKSKAYSPDSQHHLVAWIASNCGPTHSRREDLVHHLQKFVPVDIYGKCGTFNCSEPLTPDGSTIHDCYVELGQKKQYKFYLSLETALCVDYVTEKLFGALKNDMVPIVYGGAIYKHFAPPGSFINSQDFLTVESLANYIKYLDENPQEYQKYFKWKEKYRIQNTMAWCELCNKLWDISILNEQGERVIDPNYRKVSKDTGKWWFYDRNGIEKQKPACRSPPKFSYNKLNSIGSSRKRRKT